MPMSAQEFTATLNAGWQSLTPETRMALQPYVMTVCGVAGVQATAALNPASSTPMPGLPNPNPNPTPPTPHHHPGSPCNGSCGGACGPAACATGACLYPTQPGTAPMLPGSGGTLAPNCYDCDCVDPCLYPYLAAAKADFDDPSWVELWKKESPVVHINKPVGLGADYQAATPLAANQKILWAQEDSQQLPWMAGGMKVSGRFATEPGPSGKVKFNLFMGPKGLTNIPAATKAGLIQFSTTFTLDDFVCGDGCFIMAFPRHFNCRMSPIPHLRALYVEALVEGIGANTVQDLNFTIIKRGTRDWKKSCKKYSIDMDD